MLRKEDADYYGITEHDVSEAREWVERQNKLEYTYQSRRGALREYNKLPERIQNALAYLTNAGEID